MKYFKMSEFACRCGCEVPASARENIEGLVSAVLDPVRERLGKAIYVNSGYRCSKHNLKVGGAKASQHIKGEAADIRCEDNEQLKRLIKEQGVFDQMIVYSTFVHVSYKRVGGNRHQVLKKV
ncbi:MAG: peptidase M15 [Bacteroidales bacterium]|nr:peptidase M15 [Bacteroidales bacterium]